MNLSMSLLIAHRDVGTTQASLVTLHSDLIKYLNGHAHVRCCNCKILAGEVLRLPSPHDSTSCIHIFFGQLVSTIV